MSDNEEKSVKKIDRKAFIKTAGLVTLGSVLANEVVFGSNFPDELEPVGMDQPEEKGGVPGKSADLTVLNSKPWNAETPPHLLDDPVTPSDRFFVRNNGLLPDQMNVETWTLTIEGESAEQKKTYTRSELKSRFKHHTLQLTLECGGNGRNEFSPPAKGNQWSVGAVGCPEWTGVKLKDVLNDVGIRSNAVYIGYYGKDVHLSGDRGKVVISRGVPIRKALEDESLIAWAMNGEDLPPVNGYPLRLVFGGWPASTSGKWLHKIVIRDKVHDGPKMGGTSYRIPKYPVAPGTKVPEEDMKIIESMPVKSIITYPKTGAIVKGQQKFEVRGHAWAGDLSVKEVQVSIDFGATWLPCEVKQPVNRLVWQRWKTTLSLPRDGYYEIWARAMDSEGTMQPMIVPGWNPKGYLNNATHRIAVKRQS